MNKQLCPDTARAQTIWSESARIQALESYEILDTPLESLFDDIAQLAADVCETPIAVVNFVASERQWFKAEVGIGTRELPLDVSICRHAILQPGLFVVPDLTKDSRFECIPLVEAVDGLRFYAGALIQTSEGLPLGTVCVLDTKPRADGLAERQGRLLKTLARQVMSELELRRALKDRDAEIAAARKSEATLRQSEVRLQMAQRAARAVSWEWDFAAGEIHWGDLHTARELAGDDLTEMTTFDQWMGKIHPDDVEQQLAESAAAWRQAAGTSASASSGRAKSAGWRRWAKSRSRMTTDAR